MALFMIARIVKNKQLVGIRILDTETNKTKDVGTEQVIALVSTGKVKIDNIQIVNNAIVGINGSIERYGILGESQSVTLLAAFKNGDSTEGFRVSDCNGMVKNLKLSDIFKLADAGMPIANGKICVKDGKQYLSAINGEYAEIDMHPKVAQQAKAEEISDIMQATCNNICDIFKAEKIKDGEYKVTEVNGRSATVKALNKYEASLNYMMALLVKAEVMQGVENPSLDSRIVCNNDYILLLKYSTRGILIRLSDLHVINYKEEMKPVGMAGDIVVFYDGENLFKSPITDLYNRKQIKGSIEDFESEYILAEINGTTTNRLCNPFSPVVRTILIYHGGELISIRIVKKESGKEYFVDIDTDAIADTLFPNINKKELKECNNVTCGLAERLIPYSSSEAKEISVSKTHMVDSDIWVYTLLRILQGKNKAVSAARFNAEYEGTEHYGALEKDLNKMNFGVKFMAEPDNRALRMNELVKKLNEARKTYEVENREIISNFEYDKLYDELLQLEKELGYTLTNSPTQNVGYEVVGSLQKEKHSTVMLSLDKTKEISKIKEFLRVKEGVLSWKMDGLTVVITYKDGTLFKAVTRGNGEIGEIVTHNAKQFKNLPKKINLKGELVIRGEAIIRYSEFEKINDTMADDSKFKNPRNLCSGSVRQLDSQISSFRNIEFYAFKLVKCDEYKATTVTESLEFLQKCGIAVAENVRVNYNNAEEVINSFKSRVKSNDIPSDGLVITYNDIAYGESLGNTGKFPRHSLAFKWQDELAETTLTGIEWSCSRTGLINPVALFEPVDLEGSTVARASIHNVSIMRELELGIGDTITVYKANMIIPQIADNLTRSDTCLIPDYCPVCDAETEIKMDINSGVETLYCTNEYCQAKGLRLFTHFVSRDAMNIDGLSTATLERFMNEGFIEEFADIYKLDQYAHEIMNLEGFGVRSYERLIESIDKSRKVKLANLLYSLGIPNVGLQTAKLFVKAANYSIRTLVNMSAYELMCINGVGDVIASSLYDWWHTKENVEKFVRLYDELEIVPETISTNKSLQGKTLCCTGGVEIFSNRNHLKDTIESMGGKLTGSVTKNTDYLITNDTTSGSSKNREAAKLGIPILSEQDFIDKFSIEL